MTDMGHLNKKCRKCGKSNLKIYEDGSGFCLDCNETFADINDYGLEKKNDIYANENIFSKKTDQPVVSKWKDPQQYVAILTPLYFIFGLGFLVIGIWNIMLFLSDGFFPFYTVTYIISGCLFFISGMSINDGHFKQAFYMSIIIAMLQIFDEIYSTYKGWVELDVFCVCPIVLLIFIVISAFILLRLDEGVKK